jgi:hypothetical protein
MMRNGLQGAFHASQVFRTMAFSAAEAEFVESDAPAGEAWPVALCGDPTPSASTIANPKIAMPVFIQIEVAAGWNRNASPILVLISHTPTRTF